MRIYKTDILMHDKIFAWIAIGTALVLLIPLVAMQFSAEVAWTLSDFLVMGILLFGAGFIFVVVARRFPKNRVAIGILVGLTGLWLWGELAVGLFTNWGS